MRNRIAHWAKERGLKHKYLADKCGVAETTFVRWVKNRTQPDLLQAYILSKELNVALDELVEP